MRKICLLASTIAAAAMLMGASASASTLRWTFKNRAPWQAQLEFYSLDRSAAWPGNGHAWELDDGTTRTFTIECNYGERIVYGAWTVAPGHQTGPHYWGVGQNQSQECKGSCQAICGHGNVELVPLDN